jgi:tetratricopeptide (TPR) repeat protein
LRTLQLNREGNKAFTAQTYPAATDKYIQALTFDPFVGALHLNLGLSFEGQQQAEQAQRSYKEAENLAAKEKNQTLVFAARFNQGQLLGKAKKVDEAIAMYQKALEIDPTSMETKTNIELLTQGQGGQGGDKEQENKDDKQGDDKKDQKGDGKDPKDQKDPKDSDKDKDKDGKDKKEDKPKQMQQSAKYKPRPYDGKELSESDVKKILGELKQQEEKIRAEYNKKDFKEQPRDKDW